VYRKALRLFLLGELSKPELDAVVIYALGEDKGTYMCPWLLGCECVERHVHVLTDHHSTTTTLLQPQTHTVHLHNDLIRGLVQNIIGGAPPEEDEDGEEQAMTLASVAGAVAMLQREEGPAEAFERAAGAAGGRRKRPLVEVEGGSAGASASDSDGDSDSESEQEEAGERARAATLQQMLQAAFGGRSALWDVWAPMRGTYTRHCKSGCCCRPILIPPSLPINQPIQHTESVSYTHLRAHET